MRLLICGGRDYSNAAHLHAVLDAVVRDQTEVVVCTGGARGADYLAEQWAHRRGYVCHVFCAEWRRYGNAAGPVRNAKMLRDFEPTLVVAFPGARGTADMARKARAAGVPVKIVEPT